MQYFKQKLNQFKGSTAELLTTAKNTIVSGTNSIITEAKTSILGPSGDIGQSIKEQKLRHRQLHPTTCDDFLLPIIDQVYYMPFPVESVRQKYGELLKSTFTVNYRVWNVSEHSYEYRCFNDQVNEYVSVGYPNPPLLDLFMVCKEISSWISTYPANVAIIHCQKTKTRSILVLSCLLYYKGLYQHPAEAMVSLCKTLEIPENQVLDACNSVYANYFSLLYSNLRLNGRKVLIKKIVLNQLPGTKLRLDHLQLADTQRELLGEDGGLLPRPYLQLYHQNALIYSSLSKQSPVPPEHLDSGPLSFNVSIPLDGDLLLRIRNYVSDQIRYPVLRLMANSTFFLNKPVRFLKRDIDFGETATVPDDFYMDLFVDFSDEQSDYHSKLMKIRLTERHLNKPNVPVTSRPSEPQEDEGFEIGDEGSDEEDEKDREDLEDRTPAGPEKQAAESGRGPPIGDIHPLLVSGPPKAQPQVQPGRSGAEELPNAQPSKGTSLSPQGASTDPRLPENQAASPRQGPQAPPGVLKPEGVSEEAIEPQQDEDERQDESASGEEEEVEDVQGYLEELEKTAGL